MKVSQVLPFARPDPRRGSSLGTSRPAQGGTAAPRERNVPLRRALQGAEAPRPGQGVAPAPREPRGGGGGKEVEKDGVAAGVAGGRRRRRWDAPEVGWRGEAPQSVGQYVSRSALPARSCPQPAAPASDRDGDWKATPHPSARAPRPFPGLFAGPPALPAPRRVGPPVSAGPGARPHPVRARPLPLPPLALRLWLPRDPVPFMRRGPITC